MSKPLRKIREKGALHFTDADAFHNEVSFAIGALCWEDLMATAEDIGVDIGALPVMEELRSEILEKADYYQEIGIWEGTRKTPRMIRHIKDGGITVRARLNLFLDTLNKSEAVQILDACGDDYSPLLEAWEIDNLRGESGNEIVRFSHEDGLYKYSLKITEEGAAGGYFDSVTGHFHCCDSEGDKVTMKFYNIVPFKRFA